MMTPATTSPAPVLIRVEDLPPVLTVEEAAAVLRVCRKTLYEMVQRGDIKAARLGKKGVLRFKREVILALLGG